MKLKGNKPVIIMHTVNVQQSSYIILHDFLFFPHVSIEFIHVDLTSQADVCSYWLKDLNLFQTDEKPKRWEIATREHYRCSPDAY